MMLRQIPPHSPQEEARRPEDAKVRTVRRIRRVREELAEALAKFDAVLNVELQDGEMNVGEKQTGEAQPGETQRPEIQFGELDKIAADVTRAARRMEYRTGVSTGRAALMALLGFKSAEAHDSDGAYWRGKHHRAILRYGGLGPSGSG